MVCLGADVFRARVVQIDMRLGSFRLFARGGATIPEAWAAPAARAAGMAPCASAWEVMAMRLNGCGSIRAGNFRARMVDGRNGARRASGTSNRAATGSPPRKIRADVLFGTEFIQAVESGMHAEPMFPGEAGLVGKQASPPFHHSPVTFDAGKGRLLPHDSLKDGTNLRVDDWRREAAILKSSCTASPLGRTEIPHRAASSVPTTST